MKSLLLAASALVLTASANLSPATAAEPQNRSPATAQGAAHWEWQYHYVGHHPRYEGHWVLVK